MACHYRVAAPSARLGLPEVRIGLLPGAGGTQRLPRLAGIEASLQMILSGDPVTARQAATSGLVDRVIDEARLTEDAVAFCAGGWRCRTARDAPPTWRPRWKKARSSVRPRGAVDRPGSMRRWPAWRRSGARSSFRSARASRASGRCSSGWPRGDSRRHCGISSLPSAHAARSTTSRRTSGHCRSRASASSAPAPWAAASR